MQTITSDQGTVYDIIHNAGVFGSYILQKSSQSRENLSSNTKECNSQDSEKRTHPSLWRELRKVWHKLQCDHFENYDWKSQAVVNMSVAQAIALWFQEESTECNHSFDTVLLRTPPIYVCSKCWLQGTWIHSNASCAWNGWYVNLMWCVNWMSMRLIGSTAPTASEKQDF